MIWPFLPRRERLRRRAAAWLACLEGQPSAADRQAFARWYEASPDHQEAFERVRSLYRSAGMISRTEAARSRDRSDIAPRPTRGPRLAVAAALAAILVAGLAALLAVPRSPEADDASGIMAVTTDVGEIRELPLAEGSRVILDTQTSIEIGSDGETRQVRLRSGRARFVLGAETERPLSVVVGATRITARTATFEVAMADGMATIRAIAGELSIDASGRAAAAPLRLAPGELVSISAAGVQRQRDPSARSPGLWPQGRLDFDNRPLGEVVAEANRYSRVPIRLGSPRLADLRVTGTFRAGDVAGLARSLADAFELRVEQVEGSHILLMPGRAAPGPHK